MFWSKKKIDPLKDKTEHTFEVKSSSCSLTTPCPRCGYPVEGLALVCPRCREELPRGCSGNCSSCGK